MPAFDLQEVDLLRRLSFDGNIVQFYGVCLQRESIMMVLEYMAVSPKCPSGLGRAYTCSMSLGSCCMWTTL